MTRYFSDRLVVAAMGLTVAWMLAGLVNPQLEHNLQSVTSALEQVNDAGSR